MSSIVTLGPVGFNPTGAYDPTKQYTKLDVVYYQGSSYVATDDSIGQLPTNSDYWDCIALGTLKQFTYNSVAEMKADTVLEDGMFVGTAGYYSANDGGGAEYKITSTQPVNQYYETLNNGLYAILIIDDNTNVLNFGAKGDGTTNNNTAFTNAFTYLKDVKIPLGDYVITTMFTLTWGQSVIGINNPTIILGNNSFLTLVGRNTVKNLKFRSSVNLVNSTTVIETPAIITGSLGYCLIDNIGIGITYIGIDVNVQGHSTINNIYGYPLKYGIKITDSVDNITIDNVNFNPNYFGNQIIPYLKKYVFENAYAFYIGRADWGECSNCFVLGYKGLVTIHHGTTIGGAANNFVFNNFGLDGCYQLFNVTNYGGGFKFSNGTCTFYNIFATEIEEAGLEVTNAAQYPISLSLPTTSGIYENTVFTITNCRFYRSDYNLVLCQSSSRLIFTNNIIENCFGKTNHSAVSPMIYSGASSFFNVSNNVFMIKTDVGDKAGVNNNNNVNNIVTNNVFYDVRYPVGEVGTNTHVSNNVSITT